LASLGVDTNKVRISEVPVTLFIVGVLSPVMVLPVNLRELVGEDEASLVIRHELAHLRRGDLRWDLLSRSVRIMHWWNPLVGRFVRECNLATEGICDRDALCGEDGRAYAHCLVNLAEKMVQPGSQSLALSVTGDFEQLKKRLLWIAENPAEPGERVLRMLQAGCVGLAGLLVSGLAVVNAGAELPAKMMADVNLKMTISAKESEVSDGVVTYKDARIVTELYECRAPLLVMTSDKNQPDKPSTLERFPGGEKGGVGEK
jgi:beta-lactamase regulating signal transducer with metallopeptidase domain